MYSFDLKNVVPSGDLTCLFAKATIDESKLWHRRLGHVNFKTMNKLVKENLVRGLPSKTFENDHTCVACQKGKQHKASCKTKHVSSISQPLQMLHMDLFGPTSVRSINHKTYCLVVTDDFSRFSWVFFLATKSETSGILKKFITEVENQLNHKVKVIRVLVTKPHNKTSYELIIGKAPSISFMRPFGCLVTIINILDPLGKFDRKAKEGFFVGYFVNSKAFRVFNSQTRKVEENLHVNFLENKQNVAGTVVNVDNLRKDVSTQQDLVFPLWSSISSSYKSLDDKAEDDTVDYDACKKTVQEPASEYDQALKNVLDKMMDQEKEATEQSYAVRKEFEAPCNSQLFQEKITRASSITVLILISTPVICEFIPGLLVPRYCLKFEVLAFLKAYDDHDLGTLNTPYVIQSVGAEMDVKSAFLYGTIEGEVYVCQPPGFVDPEFPKKVYKVEKALYGLHQAPRAWYETLSTYLLDNGFHKGQIDKTLFTKRLKGDI
ncbi:ribonuclease H-like domain-containing protein [Tanacetum coccineum]